MRRFIRRQWNLRTRALAAKYTRFKQWCVEFYVTERAIYHSRQKQQDTKPGGIVITHKGARVAKMTRQLRKQILRDQENHK